MKHLKSIIAMMVLVMMTLSMGSCGSKEERGQITIDESRDEKVQVQVSDQEAVSESIDINEGDLDTGLQADVNEESVEDQSESEKASEDNNSADTTLAIIDGWSLDYKDYQVELPYEAPSYEVVKQPLSIEEQYDTIVNREQFTGFSDGQQAMLKEQGFVVMPLSEKNITLKMHTTYEMAEYDNSPMFISSDAVLNMYHLFYSESMKYLEFQNYSKSLITMSDRLLEEIGAVYSKESDEVKEELQYVYAYIAVGNHLLNINTDLVLPSEVQVIVAEELENIENLKMVDSIMYGKKVDYSQYIVRGHYTLHEDLSDYFKAMMWYSQTGIQLTKEENGESEILPQGFARSLMMTELLFDDEENVLDWTSIYDITKLYSGYSDDLNPYDLRDLITTVYGDDHDYQAYIDTSYEEKLQEEAKNLRKAKVNAKTGDETSESMPSGLQFRLMGQRYTLDANIMQELMDPYDRPMPTAFDVLTAFGHPVAEEVLYEYYPTNQNWLEYDENMDDMKALVENYDDWQDSLYSGWLWAIDSAARSYEKEEDYPYFMQTRAWSHKNLSSALGSFAELKHDNILYSKQAFAEAGGPMYKDEHHYVEPNVELYSKLYWLCVYTRMNLEGRDDVEAFVFNPLKNMEEMLLLLMEVSEKELAGEEVSSDEFFHVGLIGGLMDNLTTRYMFELNALGVDVSIPKTGSMIADVATSNDSYLEEAIGLPREIYAVCYVNDKSFIAKGSVYSYFEFVSGQRMTDEEWQVKAGVSLEEYKDTGIMETRFTGEEVNHLEMMPWMASYISSEPNKVEVKDVEIEWKD